MTPTMDNPMDDNPIDYCGIIQMDEQSRDGLPFPMLGGPFISWPLARVLHRAYEGLGHRQSLERIAERGGFGWAEVKIMFDELRRRKPSLYRELMADSTAALSRPSLEPTLGSHTEGVSGADPAFVASQSSQQAVSPVPASIRAKE